MDIPPTPRRIVTGASTRTLGLAIGLLLLAACGSSASTGAASPSTAPEVAGQAITVDGGQFDLGSLEGQDSVLWFWAPW